MNDKKSEDMVWSEWMEDFRRSGKPIPNITAGLRKSAVWMIIELVVWVVSAPVMIGALYYVAVVEQSFTKTVGVLFVMVFMAVGAVVSYRMRRGTWRVVQETPRQLLATLRKQETARLREAKIMEIAVAILLIGIALWTPWQLWYDWSKYADNPWGGVLRGAMIGATLVFGWWYTRWWTRRKEQGVERVKQLESEFLNLQM